MNLKVDVIESEEGPGYGGIPLGMKFGGIGCALGTAISMVVGNGFIMNWYYQTHIGQDMRYFWKHILSIVPAMLPAVALGHHTQRPADNTPSAASAPS